MWETVRVERGRQRVKFTGFERHGLYGLEDIVLGDKVGGVPVKGVSGGHGCEGRVSSWVRRV